MFSSRCAQRVELKLNSSPECYTYHRQVCLAALPAFGLDQIRRIPIGSESIRTSAFVRGGFANPASQQKKKSRNMFPISHLFQMRYVPDYALGLRPRPGTAGYPSGPRTIRTFVLVGGGLATRPDCRPFSMLPG